jgi:hypothetical protein
MTSFSVQTRFDPLPPEMPPGTSKKGPRKRSRDPPMMNSKLPYIFSPADMKIRVPQRCGIEASILPDDHLIPADVDRAV